MHFALLTTGRAVFEPAVLDAGHQVTFVAPVDRVAGLRAQYPGRLVVATRSWDDEAALEEVEAQLPDDVDVVATIDEQAIWAAGWLRTHRSLPGQSQDQALGYTDKAVMLERLQAAGLPVAAFRIVTNDAQVEQAAHEVGGFPVVVKPVRGQGAVNTFPVRDRAHLDELRAQDLFTTAEADASGRFGASARLAALNDQGGFIVQRYIEMDGPGAREFWCDVHAFDGEVLLAPAGWYDTPPMTAGGRHRYWASLAPDDPEVTDVKKLAATAVQVLDGATGVSHVEVLRDRHGALWVGEAAFRIGGGKWQAYSRQYGFDTPTVLTQLAAGQRPPIKDLTPCHPVLATLSLAPPAGTVTRIAPAEQIGALPGVVEVDLRLREGEPVPAPIGVVPMSGRIVWAPTGSGQDSIATEAQVLIDALRLEIAPDGTSGDRE